MNSNDWPPLRLEPEKVIVMRQVKSKAGTSTVILAALLATGCVHAPKLAHGQTAAPAMSVAPETPEQFLGKIYKRYRENGPGVSMDDPKLATRVFDPSIISAFAAINSARPMDIDDVPADFFCNCQDYGVSNVQFTTVKNDYARPTVLVSFSNFNKPDKVLIDLARNGSRLMITDIRSEKDSLRASLQRAASIRKIKLSQ